MDRQHIWAIIDFSDMASPATKDHHAVSGHAQNGGYLRVWWTLDEKMKSGAVSVKIVSQELLLRGDPIIQVEPMRAAPLLEKLVGTFRHCRLNDLQVLFIFALDCDHPVVATLSGVSLHLCPPVPSIFDTWHPEHFYSTLA